MQLLLWKDLPQDQSALLEQNNGHEAVVRENVERLSMGTYHTSLKIPPSNRVHRLTS